MSMKNMDFEIKTQLIYTVKWRIDNWNTELRKSTRTQHKSENTEVKRSRNIIRRSRIHHIEIVLHRGKGGKAN